MRSAPSAAAAPLVASDGSRDAQGLPASRLLSRGAWLLEPLSALMAGCCWIRLAWQHPGALAWLRERPLGVWSVLRSLALARLVLKTGRHGVRADVPLEIRRAPRAVHGPCVYAVLPSPLHPLIASRALRALGLVLFAKPSWARRVGDRRRGLDRGGLRDALRRLRGGESIATALSIDAAGESRALFLGLPARAFAGPVRLAAASGASLCPVVTTWTGDRVRVTIGAPRVVPRGAAGRQRALQDLLDEVGARVERDPACWSRLLPFLRRAPPLLPLGERRAPPTMEA